MTKEEFRTKLGDIAKTAHGKLAIDRLHEDFKGQLPIMHYLYISKENNLDVTPNDIAKEFNLSTARIARALNTLEEKKYIVRTESKEDKRKTIVNLTELGIEIHNDSDKKMQEFFYQAIDGLTEEDYEALLRILGKISKNIVGGNNNA